MNSGCCSFSSFAQHGHEDVDGVGGTALGVSKQSAFVRRVIGA